MKRILSLAAVLCLSLSAAVFAQPVEFSKSYGSDRAGDGVQLFAPKFSKRRIENDTGDGSLSDVIASAVFDLDATQAASYTSGTTWANLVTAPADGSAQTAYDFYTGDGATSTTYPAFNGSGSTAYWSFDGGDFFRLKSGTNTAFLAGLHKTTGGSDFWMAITIRIPDVTVNATKIFTTLPATGSSNFGVSLQLTTAEVVQLLQRASGSSSNVSLGTMTQGTDYLLVISHSHSANNTRYWFNSLSQTNAAQTFVTETTNANGLATIGSESDGGLPLTSGARVYSFAMGNEYLDNTKAAAIIAALEARHGRDYTP